MCSVPENHQPVASHTPPTGDPPASQAGALPGNRIGNLPVLRPVLSPLSHTSQGREETSKGQRKGGTESPL